MHTLRHYQKSVRQLVADEGEFLLKASDGLSSRLILYTTYRSSNRWGSCKIAKQCTVGMIFWPKDGRCYAQYTKGPCVKGKLLVLNKDGLGECKVCIVSMYRVKSVAESIAFLRI